MVDNAWRRYWEWYGLGYGLFQAGMACMLAASGIGLVTVPLAWLFFGPDLGVGFPWR